MLIILIILRIVLKVFYEPRQVVLLKDVNAINEVTSIKYSYKTTDVGDSINGALNPSVTFG